jgi:hypothetical protein
MTAVRALLMLAGVALLGYGGLLLWTDNPWPIIMRIGIWAAAGVVLHDFVFAPLAVAIGATGRRLLPSTWQAPVAIAALLTVTLLLLAIPVYDKPGARPDNATVLDRDYHQGLSGAVLTVWVGAALWILGAVAARRRKGVDSAPRPQVPLSATGGTDIAMSRRRRGRGR